MRLLIITHDFPPTEGGIATHALGLAVRLRQLGWDVAVQTPHCGPFVCPVAGVDVSMVYTPGIRQRIFRLLLSAAFARRTALSFRPDVVYGTHWRGCGLASLRASAAMGAPCFIGIHGTDVYRASRRRLERAVFLRMAGRVTGFLALGGLTARILQGMGIPESKIMLRKEGIVLFEHREPAPEEVERFRREKGWNGRRILLTVARLEERKGHDVVLRAMARLLGQRKELLYVIAGRGAEETRLRRIAADLGIGSYVRFEGFVPKTDLPLYYAASDVFVMPNREVHGDIEGFGISFVEAGFYRRPVVGGLSGGTVDSVLEGETGFLVDPTDAAGVSDRIGRLLDDPDRARRMGDRGHDRAVGELNYVVIAREAGAIFSAAVREAAGGPPESAGERRGEPLR